MQAIRNGYDTSKEFVSSVIEFRSPVSPVYWMIVNSAFWWSVFYLNKEYQLRLMISLAACIFGWDVLLSPSHEHSPVVHLLLWPFRETLRVSYCFDYNYKSLFIHGEKRRFWRPGDGHINITSRCFVRGCSAIFFGIIHACEMTWRGIANGFYTVWRKLADGVTGLYRGFIAFVIKIRNSISSGAFSIREFFLFSFRCIRDSILAVLATIYFGIINGIMATWRAFISMVYSVEKATVNYVFDLARKLKAIYLNILHSLIYLSSNFFHALKTYILNVVHFSSSLIGRYVLCPARKIWAAVKSFVIYWFCAHWWPGLKGWIKENITRPLEKGNLYFQNEYVLFQQLDDKQNFLFSWGGDRLKDLTVILRELLHKLAVKIKDSVLWPVCMLIVDILQKIGKYMKATVLQPITDYLYWKYKFCEDYILINVLAPACTLIINHIPEKSPFCGKRLRNVILGNGMSELS
ncbi:unnamed protein product [Enterobius vermicularis]|uniref:Uncharacterized protein n=1 Tax=Enterobius vermicularis TaxID=51028 RepID=A0A0N4VGG0_ENTVE|nr:unnamed protein product [Enterobius vermicularis]